MPYLQGISWLCLAVVYLTDLQFYGLSFYTTTIVIEKSWTSKYNTMAQPITHSSQLKTTGTYVCKQSNAVQVSK